MRLIADIMLRGGGIVADPGDPIEVSEEQGEALIAARAAHVPVAESAEPVKEQPAPETAEEQPAEPVERAVPPKPASRRNKRRKAAAQKVSGKK